MTKRLLARDDYGGEPRGRSENHIFRLIDHSQMVDHNRSIQRAHKRAKKHEMDINSRYRGRDEAPAVSTSKCSSRSPRMYNA